MFIVMEYLSAASFKSLQVHFNGKLTFGGKQTIDYLLGRKHLKRSHTFWKMVSSDSFIGLCEREKKNTTNAAVFIV